MNAYSSININEFLESDTPQQGERILIDSYANFSCPINKDVETFLLHHSISSSKKGQSATYLVVNDNTEEIVGYYTLAIKPISVPTSCISKTSIKKLSRISDYDEITNTHTLSAYLIAQLGKNFSVNEKNKISGKDLLEIATEQIITLRHLAGGVVQFLECEDNQKLLSFYSENGFTPFNHRMTKGTSPHKLHQLLKFI